MASSPDITGGKGFSFEDIAVAKYLLALLANDTAPGVSGYIVTQVEQQRAAFDQPLDDLIVEATSSTKETMTLSLQVKSTLTVSAAQSNKDFRDSIEKCWATISMPNFQKGRDRVGIVVGTIADGMKNALTTIAEWARGSADSAAFLARFEADRGAGADRRSALKSVRDILSGSSGDDVFDLLRHFTLIKVDALHEGATDEAAAISLARRTLDPSAASQAVELWNALKQSARNGAGIAAQVKRPALLNDLGSRFQFTPAPSLNVAVTRLTEEGKFSLGEISNEIDGSHVDRPKVQRKLDEAVEAHRFVQIVGLPGSGKSGTLLAFASQFFSKGNVLALKADRVNAPGWNAYAQSIGLPAVPVVDLLAEIGATGTPILFIDGLDRFTPANKGVVVDLLNTIRGSSALSRWKVVATLRDTGIEPVRTWLPPSIFRDLGVGTVEVGPFDDDEALALAKKKPSLQHLLFGADRVKEIARRPFFASVMLRSIDGNGTLPKSEVELIEAWWKRGGYDAGGGEGIARQTTLLSFAQAGAPSLGSRFSLSRVDTNALQALLTDGIVRRNTATDMLQFSHDIFFEWVFYRLLLQRGAGWTEAITSLGELPGLGRSVELLSQHHFALADNWAETLGTLEHSAMRSQWQRAWLLAPFGMQDFLDRAEQFNTALAGGEKRQSRVIVWYQAEKTKPNPLIISSSKADNEQRRRELMRTADALAWPSDIRGWRRFCTWLLAAAPTLPLPLIPDAVTALSVWQNIGAGTPNDVSKEIFRQFLAWLTNLEDHVHSREFKWDKEGWDKLSRAELSELEEALRTEILRAASVERDAVSSYLGRLAEKRSLRHGAFKTVMLFAPSLAVTHPEEIARLTKAELLGELPEVAMNRPSNGMIPHSMSYHDWHSLSITDRNGFFPVSPLREPFHALLRNSNTIGLELIATLGNHAIAAWKQLHRYDYHRQGTPLPITIEFPWGAQTFFGDHQVYSWSRGHGGPNAVESAFMALDQWAFEQLDAGVDADIIIKSVLANQESVAAVAIAIAIALAANKVTATIVALISAQRLWSYDFARGRQDGPMQVNLLGFTNRTDINDYNAVKKENDRPTRRIDIRWLAQLGMLSPDAAIRDAVENALKAFPENLPYEYQEQVGQSDWEGGLRRQAEDWAAIGVPENYHAEANPSGEGVIITVKNPRENEPEAVKARERAVQYLDRLSLVNWSEKSLKEGKVASETPPDKAIAAARALDNRKLFSTARNNQESDINQGAVTGVAATALVLEEDLGAADLKWASGVVLRASKLRELTNDHGFGDHIPLYHPIGYAIRGLGALIRRRYEADKAMDALLDLAAHHLEAIGSQALSEAISHWSIDSGFAWVALRLAIRCSIGKHKNMQISAYGYDFSKPPELLGRLTAEAKRERKKRNSIVTLPELPPTWETIAEVPRDTQNIRRIYRDEGSGTLWREPDEFLRWDFLGRVLPAIPIDLILADPARAPEFKRFANATLRWTVERFSPPWRDKRRDDDHGSRKPWKWKLAAMRFLGRLALTQPFVDTNRDILTPVFALDDENSTELLEPLISVVVCAGIIDPVQVADQAVPVISRCVDRVLLCHDWEGARVRDGDIFGHHIPSIIRDLFMLPGVEAALSSRYANGDWSDVAIIMPIIDPFVKATGDVVSVTMTFLGLCERAQKHYPAERFVEQVEAFLKNQEGTPVGWRGTTLTGRIASLIQSFAEAKHPLPRELGQGMLRILDRLVDMGDRRSAALQSSELFRSIRLTG